MITVGSPLTHPRHRGSPAQVPPQDTCHPWLANPQDPWCFCSVNRKLLEMLHRKYPQKKVIYAIYIHILSHTCVDRSKLYLRSLRCYILTHPPVWTHPLTHQFFGDGAKTPWARSKWSSPLPGHRKSRFEIFEIFDINMKWYHISYNTNIIYHISYIIYHLSWSLDNSLIINKHLKKNAESQQP